MMTTTTLARERNGAALREKLNPYVVSFLGFERALSRFFCPHLRGSFFYVECFRGWCPFLSFTSSPVFRDDSCLFTWGFFLRLRLFYGFSWLCRSLLTRDMHQSCLSCWKLLSSVCSCFCWAASWNWNMGGGFFYLIVHLKGDKIAGTIARKVSTCSVCVVLFIFPFFSILFINLVLEWDHTTKGAITEVAAVFLLIRDNVHPRLVSNNNIKVSQGIVLSGEKRFINSRL